MLEDGDRGKASDALISGGHAIVFVSNMDRSVRFYTEALGLKLTNRFGDNIAFVEAGRLVVAIHPKTPNTVDPGTKGSVMLGLTTGEPIDRVIGRLTTRGVRFTGPLARSAEGAFVPFEDPDGNVLYIWEESRAERQAEPRPVAVSRS